VCLDFGFIKPKYPEQTKRLTKKPRDATRLSEESVVVICPNPKCRREIEEPILLTILSATPPKEYEACPYCFTRLEPEPPIEEEEDASEPTVEEEETTIEEDEEVTTSPSENTVPEKVKSSRPGFLDKVKALIPTSNGSQTEKSEEPEEPEAEPAAEKEKEKTAKEEPETEPIAKEEEPKSVTEKETESSGCPESFGYLANRPPDVPIPPQCLVCPKMVDCMLSPRK
jgi:hypothetical protein